MSYEPIIDKVVKMKPDGSVLRFIKGKLLSTDRKPMQGIAEGSSVYERDTGKWYLFNEKKQEWLVPDDGSGGGGTGDYTDLENKPQINGVTLSGNKTASDLSLGTYSKPAGGIPKSDLASDVRTSLGKADTALQGSDVATAVDAWLDENVAQETGYVLDRTLQMENAAAPADLVGELKTAIDDTNSELSSLETGLFGRTIDIQLTQGTKVNSSGEIVSDNNYFCSGIIKIPDGVQKVIVTYTGTNSPNTVALYDDNQAYIGMVAGAKEANSNNRVVIFSNAYQEIRYIAVFVSRITVISAMFVIPNISEQAFYRVNTDDVRSVNLDYEIATGTSGYGTIAKAPTDLTEKLAISNVMTVVSGQSAIQTYYPAVKPHSYADAPVITSKNCVIGFIVRSKYDFTLKANTIVTYNSSGSVVGNATETIRIKKEKLDWLDDATAVTLYVVFKDAFVDGIYKLRNIIDIAFVTGTDTFADFMTSYNGYQAFYYRYKFSDTNMVKFDFSTSLLTNTYWLNKFDSIYKFKKICIYGTSIEKTNYISVTGERLRLYAGIGYFNYGNGGGGIVYDPTVTALPVDIERLEKCFSCTKAEKEEALTAAGIDPTTVDAADLNTSYDVSLLGNLDADLYIIGTYGINDRTYEDAFVVSEERAMDRTTIYGAYNYVLDKLYTAKPTAKVIILGQHLFTWENTEEVNEIQRKVAAKWGIPFADWGHKMSINSVTRSTYTSDDVHPNTAGIERLGNFLYDYLTKEYCIC